MTVIVEADRSLVELFESALGGGATALETVDQLERHLPRHENESAVVLGPSVSMETATALAERLRISRPALGVLLVRARVDRAILGDALRSGMREVVESRDLTGLADAVRRSHLLFEAMSASASSGVPSFAPAGARARLFTVFSTKGGVGKSTIATNLAAALAGLDQQVCLVDLDVNSGDVAIMLQLFPTRTLADLPSLRGGIDRAGVQSLLTEHSPGLSVLAAPLTVDAEEQILPDDVGATLRTLKSMFDVVLVDTSGSFDDLALTAFDHSDVLLLVGTLDIPALKNLKVATGTLDLLNIPRETWRLVLNRADARVGLSTSEFQETLKLDIETHLPTSREVLASVNRGEAIVQAHPKHPVSLAILALARRLAFGTNPAELEEPVAAAPLRRRLRKVR